MIAELTFTVAEVAARYSVDPHSVLQWIRAGELKALNVGRALGKKRPRWRITQAAIDAFEQQRTACPTPPRSRRRKQHHAEVIAFY